VLWKGRSSRKHLLWGFSLFSICFDYSLTYLKFQWSINTQGLGNIYILVEFAVFSYFLTTQLTEKSKYYYYLLIICVILFTFFYFQRNFSEFNKLGYAVFSLTYLILTLLVFRKTIQKLETNNLLTSFPFLVTLAIFLYTSLNFFIFLMLDSVAIQDKELHKLTWQIGFTTTNLFKYGIIALAFNYFNTNQHDQIRYR
jgi:hypothetical protein